ncbi:hypothetical protein FRC07_007266, partial [Ceratobasidium sp. 392]
MIGLVGRIDDSLTGVQRRQDLAGRTGFGPVNLVLSNLLSMKFVAILLAAIASASAAAIAPRSGTHLTQAEAERRLLAAGIHARSSGGCTNRNNPHCTSYEYILSGTVSGVTTLKNASGCPITITGGTETGHASGTYSHWNGYKVDVSINPCITNYVHRNFRKIDSTHWKSAAGNIYHYEGNHWD